MKFKNQTHNCSSNLGTQFHAAVTFFALYLLRSLCERWPLESVRKVESWKQATFIFMKQALRNLVLPGNINNEFVLAVWLCSETSDQINKQTKNIPFLVSWKILAAMWRLKPWYWSAWTNKPLDIDLGFCAYNFSASILPWQDIWSSVFQTPEQTSKQVNIPYSPKYYFYE